MEIVAMVNREIPATDIGNAHLVAGHLGGLRVPNNLAAVTVFVAHFDGG